MNKYTYIYNPKRGLINYCTPWVFLKGVLPAAKKDLLILLIYYSKDLLIERMFAPESNAMEKQVKTVETPWEAFCAFASHCFRESFDFFFEKTVFKFSRKTVFELVFVI